MSKRDLFVVENLSVVEKNPYLIGGIGPRFINAQISSNSLEILWQLGVKVGLF